MQKTLPWAANSHQMRLKTTEHTFVGTRFYDSAMFMNRKGTKNTKKTRNLAIVRRMLCKSFAFPDSSVSWSLASIASAPISRSFSFVSFVVFVV
jgi:hypothetical protein